MGPIPLIKSPDNFAAPEAKKLNILIQKGKEDEARRRASDDYTIGFARKDEDSHYVIARTPFQSTSLHSSTPETTSTLTGGRKKGKSKKKSQVSKRSTAMSTLPAGSYALPIFGEGNVSGRIDPANTSIKDLLAMGDTLLTESASVRASVLAAKDASKDFYSKLGPAWAANRSTPLLEDYLQKSNKYFVSMEYADRLNELLGHPSRPDSLQGQAHKRFSDARKKLDLGPEMSDSLADLEWAVMGKALADIDLKEAEWHLIATKIQSQLDFNNDGGAKQRVVDGKPMTHPGGAPWLEATVQTPEDRASLLKTVINNMNSSRDRLEAAQKAIDAESTAGDGVPTVDEILEKYRSLMPASAEDWAIQNEAIQDNPDEAEDAGETIASVQPDQFLIDLRENWKPKSEVNLALSWDKQRQKMKAQFMLGCTAVGSEDKTYPSLPYGSGLVNPNIKPETKPCDDSGTHDDEDPCRITPDDFKPLWTNRSAAQAFAEGVVKLVKGCSTAQGEVSGPYDREVERIVRSEIDPRDSVLKSLARTAKDNQAWIDLVTDRGPRQVFDTWLQTQQDWRAGNGEVQRIVDDFANDQNVSKVDAARLDRWHKLAQRATDPSQYESYIRAALDTGIERVYGRFREEDAKTPFEILQELEASQQKLQQDMKTFTKDMRDHGINHIPETVEGFAGALRSRASQIKVEEETARAEEARRAQEESAAELALSEKRKALHQEWLAMEKALKERFSRRTYVPSVESRNKHSTAGSTRDTAASLPGHRWNERNTRGTPLSRWIAKEAAAARQRNSPGRAEGVASNANSLTLRTSASQALHSPVHIPRTYSEACSGISRAQRSREALNPPQQSSRSMMESNSTSTNAEQITMDPPIPEQVTPEIPGETTAETLHGHDRSMSDVQDPRQEPVRDWGPEDPQTRPEYIPADLPSINAPQMMSSSSSIKDEPIPKAAVTLPVVSWAVSQSTQSAVSTSATLDAGSSKRSKSKTTQQNTARSSARSFRSKRVKNMSQNDIAAQLEHRALIGRQLEALRYQEGLQQGAGVATQLVQSQAQQYIQGLARGWSTSIQALGLETHRQFASQQSLVQSLAYQIQSNRQHIDYLDACLRTAVETNKPYVPVNNETGFSYGWPYSTTTSETPVVAAWVSHNIGHNDSGYYEPDDGNAQPSTAMGAILDNASICDSPQQLDVQPQVQAQERHEEYSDVGEKGDNGTSYNDDEAIGSEDYGAIYPELGSEGIFGLPEDVRMTEEETATSTMDSPITWVRVNVRRGRSGSL